MPGASRWGERGVGEMAVRSRCDRREMSRRLVRSRCDGPGRAGEVRRAGGEMAVRSVWYAQSLPVGIMVSPMARAALVGLGLWLLVHGLTTVPVAV